MRKQNEKYYTEEQLENLSVEERKCEYEKRLTKVTEKTNKILKTKKVLAITVLSSVIAMVGGVCVMCSAFVPAHKQQQTVINANYNYYNDLHIVEETKKLLDRVEKGEITLEEYNDQQKKIERLDEEKFMKEYASAEEYEYYQQQVDQKNDLVNSGITIAGVGALVVLSSAAVADSKERKYQKLKNGKDSLIKKIVDCDREKRQLQLLI